jgi:hypothetical protein
VLLAWSQRRANALWEGRVSLLKEGQPTATILLKNPPSLFESFGRRGRLQAD